MKSLELLMPRTTKKSLPVRGAWIEIISWINESGVTLSLPVRGAWIEIYDTKTDKPLIQVAPRKGSVD